MPSLSKQKGMVIVLALFIVALVAAMSYTMMARLARDTERTTLILRYHAALNLAEGSIAWARDQLRNNVLLHKSEQIVDQLPLTSPITEVEGYHIQSSIYDLQAFFNVNNVQTKNGIDVFKHLLQNVLPKLSNAQDDALIKAINEWLNAEVSKNLFSDYYLHLQPGYRSGHRLMQSVSELRLVKGMDARLSNALKPYVTALPMDAVVNVQTAPAMVLASLSPSMNLASANEIIKLRSMHPFTSAETFLNADIVKNHHIEANNITIQSNYFLLKTKIKSDQQEILLCTYLVRKTDHDQVTVDVIAQNIGLC